ncbi:hypothetical protein [Flagellimonas pacifica]|nr:hypothetical protein [Allomuricauda parva]
MSKVLMISAFLILSLQSSIAQNSSNVEKQQFTLNFLLPGAIYEQGISANSTLTAEATMGFAFRGCTGCETAFGVYPIGRLQYRYYYNMQRRLEKGKHISGNTGNYIAPMIAAQSGKAIIGDLDYASDFFAGAGVVYGIQRTGHKGLSFRFEAGPAYFFDEFDDNVGLFLALKLGWVLRKNP